MTDKKKEFKFDFAAHLQSVEENYKMIQILDEKGKIVNSDLLPDLSDEQLVQLFKDMLWSRALNDRCTILSRQGRLGFFGPTAGQEASQLGKLPGI
jgi:pyruvate dehydrogenase E1 component alpha subunit